MRQNATLSCFHVCAFSPRQTGRRSGTNQPPYYHTWMFSNVEHCQRTCFIFPAIVDMEQLHQCGQPSHFSTYEWVMHALFIRQPVMITASLRVFFEVWPMPRNGLFSNSLLKCTAPHIYCNLFLIFSNSVRKVCEGQTKQIIIFKKWHTNEALISMHYQKYVIDLIFFKSYVSRPIRNLATQTDRLPCDQRSHKTSW